jgi:hypothetical protein
MSPILLNLYGEYLMKEVLTDVGYFKIINKVRLTNDTALIAKSQKSYKIWRTDWMTLDKVWHGNQH